MFENLLKIMNTEIIARTVVVVLIFLLVIVASTIFIGSGFMLTLLFPLTLFESTFLCIATTFILLFIVFAVKTDNHLANIVKYVGSDEGYFFEEDDEEDEDFTEGEKESGKPYNRALDLEFGVVDKRKIGRNDPCPCGSGKKYKFCCGKQH